MTFSAGICSLTRRERHWTLARNCKCYFSAFYTNLVDFILVFVWMELWFQWFPDKFANVKLCIDQKNTSANSDILERGACASDTQPLLIRCVCAEISMFCSLSAAASHRRWDIVQRHVNGVKSRRRSSVCRRGESAAIFHFSFDRSGTARDIQRYTCEVKRDMEFDGYMPTLCFFVTDWLMAREHGPVWRWRVPKS